MWVYWEFDRCEDLSGVRNLSMGGVFIETATGIVKSVSARLHFLTPDGQNRA